MQEKRGDEKGERGEERGVVFQRVREDPVSGGPLQVCYLTEGGARGLLFMKQLPHACQGTLSGLSLRVAMLSDATHSPRASANKFSCSMCQTTQGSMSSANIFFFKREKQKSGEPAIS